MQNIFNLLTKTGLLSLIVVVLLFGTNARLATAQDIPVDKENISAISPPAYSAYAGRSYQTRVLWGDTHLHTNLSLDARSLGVLLGPEEAYRFARGEEVTAPRTAKLSNLQIRRNRYGISNSLPLSGGRPQDRYCSAFLLQKIGRSR